jgi:hypothetical protein
MKWEEGGENYTTEELLRVLWLQGVLSRACSTHGTLERLNSVIETTWKINCRNRVWKWIGFIWLRIGPHWRSLADTDEGYGITKGSEFLDQLKGLSVSDWVPRYVLWCPSPRGRINRYMGQLDRLGSWQPRAPLGLLTCHCSFLILINNRVTARKQCCNRLAFPSAGIRS